MNWVTAGSILAIPSNDSDAGQLYVGQKQGAGVLEAAAEGRRKTKIRFVAILAEVAAEVTRRILVFPFSD